MTASELKYQYEINRLNPTGLFFSRGNMRFAGDTMKNFGVRKAGMFKRHSGDTVEVYELYRKRPVKHGLQSSHYFTVSNCELVHGKLVETEKDNK